MTTTGKAAVFTGPNQPMEICEYQVMKPQGSNVLLKLKRSGICGTDIHILEGRLPVPTPLILGHEFIGEIIELGDTALDGLAEPLAVGDTVIACVALPCGECFNCKQGETASCLSFGVTYVKDPGNAPHFFGGYAEYLHHPAACLVKVPQGIDLDAVAAFPCAGPTAIRAFDFAGNLRGDELVVVQGTGPVGLFAIAWAARQGCRVLAIGSTANVARVELAHKLGASGVLDYRETTIDERVQIIKDVASEMSRGDGADVVFEASGSPQAFAEGLQLVRTLGRYIVPGQYSNSGGVEIMPQLITFKAIKIIGSGQYKLSDITTYLQFLEEHKDLQELFASCITHRYAIPEANTAWETAARGESIKAVFSE